MVQNNPLVRPYLKWAGGKRQLLAEITKYIPNNTDDFTYYEPFLGAGAVFFKLQPRRAVVNDYNEQLILTYSVIRDNVEDLISILGEYQKNNDEGHFYEIRNLDRDEARFNSLSKIEKAARMIFLNKTCFNGLYRVNSRGFFNVPFGKYKKPAICESLVLRQVSNYLASNEISITCGDFEQAVSMANEKSFVYFDPPYHSPDKTNFAGYRALGFNDSEQERLRNTMVELTHRGIKCLLSNSDTEYIRGLYKSGIFEIIAVKAKRAINSIPSGRGEVNELLIKNWEG